MGRGRKGQPTSLGVCDRVQAGEKRWPVTVPASMPSTVCVRTAQRACWLSGLAAYQRSPGRLFCPSSRAFLLRGKSGGSAQRYAGSQAAICRSAWRDPPLCAAVRSGRSLFRSDAVPAPVGACQLARLRSSASEAALPLWPRTDEKPGRFSAQNTARRPCSAASDEVPVTWGIRPGPRRR